MEDSAAPRERLRSGRPVQTALVTVVLALLVLAVAWLYCEVGRIPFSAKEWNVVMLSTRVDLAEQSIGNLASNLVTLASYLDSVAAVANNANMYAHSHYSDLRLKEDVMPLTHALEKVLLLHGVSFEWNASVPPGLRLGQRRQMGLIAQETEQVFPELVSIGPDGYKTIDYVQLTPVLIEAIKQQQAQLAVLQQKNEELELRLFALEKAGQASDR